MITKRELDTIAKAFGKVWLFDTKAEREIANSMVNEFCNAARRSNPKFNRDVFTTAVSIYRSAAAKRIETVGTRSIMRGK